MVITQHFCRASAACLRIRKRMLGESLSAFTSPPEYHCFHTGETRLSSQLGWITAVTVSRAQGWVGRCVQPPGAPSLQLPFL